KHRLPHEFFHHTRFSSERQRNGGPTGARGGDPLIWPVGKSALEVGLQRQRPGLNQPGAIFELSFEQELGSSLVNRIADRQAGGLVEGDQGLSSGVGIAW